MKELRHYCRNLRCRTKLSEPTDNPKRSFCCRGCFNSFHRSRCVVCESPIRRKTEGQKTCIKANCKAELRRFPLAYSWPKTQKTGNHPSDAITASETLDFTGSKLALSGVARSPLFWCDAKGRGWCWESEKDWQEHRLIDRDGAVAARLWPVGDVWYLVKPKTIPVQRSTNLETAKRLAVSMALAALPLDPVTAARIDRENSKPHPMGPPLNRPWLAAETISNFRISEGRSGDPGDLPEFLRRSGA